VKSPRDLSGPDLAKALRALGYAVTRQTGSHMRLTTQTSGEHHVTIPAHRQLKVGTLNGILNAVGKHFDVSHNEVLRRLGLA